MPLRDKPAQAQPTEPEASGPVAPSGHPDERRARESGGPIDRAHYTCCCGYVFHADVTASVVCPHCGATQDW